MGFEQALSGLSAASQNLDVIGNNIANASTNGFKEATAQFADVYATSLWGASSTQVGIGTQVAAISAQFTQGNITTTGNPLDVAVNGSGFFRESNNGVITYSRDGQFSLNASGQVVNSKGVQLTGYQPDPNDPTGQKISSAPPTPLVLSLAPVAPQRTGNVSLSLNLDSTSKVINTNPAAPTNYVFSPTNSSTYTSSTSMTVYDSLGNSHTMSYYFVDQGVQPPVAPATVGNTQWSVYVTGDNNLVLNAAAPGVLQFGPTGTLASGVSTTMTVPYTAAQLGNGANTMSVVTTFPVAQTSQYGVPFSVSSNSQDGYTTGQLAGFSISQTGVVSGRYTNGQTRVQGQIALANFINPQGLVAQGGNQFAESPASGAPIVGAPGTGSLGTVQSGALESSTVDLTTELVNMITAQRIYQANAETVKTQDQVQQTLNNLR